VEIGNMHVTKELLNMNGDLQVKATFGPKMEIAFHAATRRRDIELLRILNDQGSPIDATNVVQNIFTKITFFKKGKKIIERLN
jgi:hypothetical protein